MGILIGEQLANFTNEFRRMEILIGEQVANFTNEFRRMEILIGEQFANFSNGPSVQDCTCANKPQRQIAQLGKETRKLLIDNIIFDTLEM